MPAKGVLFDVDTVQLFVCGKVRPHKVSWGSIVPKYASYYYQDQMVTKDADIVYVRSQSCLANVGFRCAKYVLASLQCGFSKECLML